MQKSNPVEMDDLIASRAEDVESWCLRLRNNLLVLPSASDRFALELLFREALQNALDHGNGSNPHLTIRCRFSLNGDVAEGRISNQGEGNNHPPFPQLPVCPDCPDGRGMSIISQYTGEYRWTDQGRTIIFRRKIR